MGIPSEDLFFILNLSKRNKFYFDSDFSDEYYSFEYHLLEYDDSTPIGFIIFLKNHGSIGHSRLCYLLIDKEHQKQGYSRILMDYYFDYCKKNKQYSLDVCMLKRNLMKYFKKFGYSFEFIYDDVIHMRSNLKI